MRKLTGYGAAPPHVDAGNVTYIGRPKVAPSHPIVDEVLETARLTWTGDTTIDHASDTKELADAVANYISKWDITVHGDENYAEAAQRVEDSAPGIAEFLRRAERRWHELEKQA